MRIGFGYDSHRLEAGRKLMLGGVEIPFEKGLLGHSDGDALIHAIIDAVFGAICTGDIGRHFPDTGERFRGASSLGLLKEAVSIAGNAGYRVLNVDSTVVAEAPKLAPHIERMRETLSAVLGTGAVSIKAKSNEKMGFTGRGEGIAAYAVCLLEKKKT